MLNCFPLAEYVAQKGHAGWLLPEQTNKRMLPKKSLLLWLMNNHLISITSKPQLESNTSFSRGCFLFLLLDFATNSRVSYRVKLKVCALQPTLGGQNIYGFHIRLYIRSNMNQHRCATNEYAHFACRIRCF